MRTGNRTERTTVAPTTANVPICVYRHRKSTTRLPEYRALVPTAWNSRRTVSRVEEKVNGEYISKLTKLKGSKAPITVDASWH